MHVTNIMEGWGIVGTNLMNYSSSRKLRQAWRDRDLADLKFAPYNFYLLILEVVMQPITTRMTFEVSSVSTLPHVNCSS